MLTDVSVLFKPETYILGVDAIEECGNDLLSACGSIDIQGSLTSPHRRRDDHREQVVDMVKVVMSDKDGTDPAQIDPHNN